MNFNTQSSNVSIPKNIQELKSYYYLEKVSVKSGGYVWELKKSSKFEKIRNVFFATANSVNHNKYIYSEKLIALMDIAANPKTKHLSKDHHQIYSDPELEVLARDADFQVISRKVPNLEKEMKETPKARLKRGFAKAVRVGKGLAEMERAGIEGKILSDKYMIEVGTREHLYEVEPYFEQWQSSDTFLNFDDWLQRNHPKADVEKIIHLNNEEERLPYKLDFINGQVFRRGAPFDTAHESTQHSGQGTAIFVMDSKGLFYAGSHIRGKFHHSSFLGGSAVWAAGEIQTNEQGQILSLSSKSGHYKPTKTQNLNALKVLEKGGCDLTKIKFIELTPEGSLSYNSAKEYLESKGTCPFNGYEAFGIETTNNGNYTLTLNDKSLSKFDKLMHMRKAISFLNSKFNISSLKYKEPLPTGQSVEYPLDKFLEAQGQLTPTTWEGGKLEFENNKLKKVVIEGFKNQDRSSNGDIHFFNLLAMKGVNLSEVEIADENESIINAKEYLKLLIQALK